MSYRSIVAGVLLLVLHPAGGAAQDLDRVETLAAEGRMEAARVELMRWWDGPRATAPRERLQQALWLRGLLTLDPHEAAADYRRLAVEFPGGPYTDRALLRLARLAEAQGDADEAARWFARLLADHPGSPAGLEARAWMNARVPSEGRNAAGSSAAPAGTAEGAGSWSVQVGAFSDPARASALVERLREAGFDARLVVVESSPLVRVRTGRFADDAGARTLCQRLEARGFESLVVSDASRERPVG